jgi:3-deoxy-D-manno-octulosonic-acid transferase
MENFRDEADTLLAAKAAIQVADAAELATRLQQLLSDPARSTALGEAARKEVDARRDMADRYLAAIRRYCAD